MCVYLCLTVDPAARGATVLLGERLDAPTLVALAAGPGWREEITINRYEQDPTLLCTLPDHLSDLSHTFRHTQHNIQQKLKYNSQIDIFNMMLEKMTCIL